MSVEELIELLQEFPDDAEVTITVGGEVCDYPEVMYNEKYNIVDIGTT
ncbi:hypothetical protein IGI37_000074 [Enterococcus sp. AZ194]